MSVPSLYNFPVDTPVQRLEVRGAYDKLTENEKLYAWALSQAAWKGSLSVLIQTSPESPLIFAFLLRLFRSQSVEKLRTASVAAGISEADFDSFILYSAAFFANMGNYKSFGDTKFIPTSEESVTKIVLNSAAYQTDAKLRELWEAVRGPMFSLKAREKQLALGADKGISTYFSYNCTEEDGKLAQAFMDSKGLSPYNTRLFKIDQGHYELRLASSIIGPASDDVATKFLGKHKWQDVEIEVTRGDYSKFMEATSQYLLEAKQYAANDNEREMLDYYVSSFKFGSIADHINGSRAWIRDKGPIIETYIGFIESYRDPYGTRGEFEGFVALVNKTMSERFQALVDNAETFIKRLPWPKEFEKDKFLRPDFTSLDIITFSGSGIPAGINIPNYDVIRQYEGFKNVSLGNVLAARNAIKDVPILNPHDLELYRALQGKSFEVQVAIHELLGHGSGKLLSEDASGVRNFPADLLDPVTAQPIKSFYKHGDTYDAVFAGFSSAYEECRAEATGIFLCLDREILSIFGHSDEQTAKDVIYVNYLIMVRAGLIALEMYTPETKAWRQAHMQARFVILRVLLEAGQGLVKIVKVDAGADGQPDVYIELDRTKIETVGREAIGAFLRKLQVFKSTADFARATEFFGGYSLVDDEMLSLRPIILARQKPRPLFVQPNLVKTAEGSVELLEYDSSAAGLVKSFLDRFPSDDELLPLVEYANADKHHFVI